MLTLVNKWSAVHKRFVKEKSSGWLFHRNIKFSVSSEFRLTCGINLSRAISRAQPAHLKTHSAKTETYFKAHSQDRQQLASSDSKCFQNFFQPLSCRKMTE